MQNYSKYAKIALVLVFSILLTIVVQSGSYQQKIPVNTNSTKSASLGNMVEKTAVKNSKQSKEKPTEKSTAKKEKATEKATKPKVKATEKPTEKATKPKVKATEKPTEAITQAPTETVTQLVTVPATEFVIDVTVQSENSLSSQPVLNNPTEPPTEWSQELQDMYDAQYNAGYLVAIDNPDYGYCTGQVTLSEEDKKLACQIVYGEAGGEGFEGCCLVAQCLKDSMVFLGYNSIADVQKYCRYDGWQENYSQTAADAVNYIFDQNRSAVAHRILYFYATNLCTSKWHETQHYVLTRNNSRFFDMW